MTRTFVLLLNWEIDGVGGVNEVVKNLYQRCESLEDPNPLLLINDWGCLRTKYVTDNERATARMRFRSPYTRKRTVRNIVFFLLELPYVVWRNWRFTRKFGVTAINAHYPSLSAIHWVILKKLRLFHGDLILSLHGRDLRDAINTSGLELWLWGYLFQNCDWVVSCSAGLAMEVEEAFPQASNKSVIIHNGIDTERTTRLASRSKQRTQLSSNERYILNVGTYEHKKGQDVLVKAFASSIDRLPSKLNLVIVGRTAEALPDVIRLIDDLGVSDRVRIIRDISQEEVLRVLASAEIFVLSSRNEAFSIALLEAAALSIPIISTDVCGVRELIPNDDFGTVIRTDDPERLSIAMIKTLSNYDEALLKSKRLNVRVNINYKWDIALTAYLELVEKK